MTEQAPDTLDAESLFREETYTDRKIGTLHKLVPVDANGEDDSSRSSIFMGSAQIYTPNGPLPINFEIEAESLADAIAGFGPAANAAVEKTMNDLREMQRQQESSIVVPGQGADPSNPLGGKIQIP